MKTLAVIPARYGSTRLPAKVLLKRTGKYLMQHTYEQVLKCRLVDRIIIATDDRRVYKAAESFRAEARMTSTAHACGTDRIAETVRHLPYDYVINVQADEPEIDPKALDNLILALHKDKTVDMATLAAALHKNDISDPNKVKVSVNHKGFAVGFSRDAGCGMPDTELFRHIGIYGYKKDILLGLIKLPRTASEKELRLEQLRALENGLKIKVVVIKKAAYGIDTPKDYEQFAKRILLFL